MNFVYQDQFTYFILQLKYIKKSLFLVINENNDYSKFIEINVF